MVVGECAVQPTAVGAEVCGETRKEIKEIEDMRMASGEAPHEDNPKKYIENILQRCIQILAKPRAKEFVPIPVPGWPEWPAWPLEPIHNVEMECRVHDLHNGCCVGGSEVIVTPPASKPERATEDKKTSLGMPEMECRVHLHNGKEIQQREIDELLTYLVPKNESPVQVPQMAPGLRAPKRSFAQRSQPRAEATEINIENKYEVLGALQAQKFAKPKQIGKCIAPRGLPPREGQR